MLKMTLALTAAALGFGAVAVQAQTPVTGTFQELPTTVVPLPAPPPQPIMPLPSGNVSVITTLPNLPPGGVVTGPGPLPGTGAGNFVTLGAPPPPPSWDNAPGFKEASTKNDTEKHEGRWICRAVYNGLYFVGHRRQAYGKNMCLFALGDKIMTTDQASMLYRVPDKPLRWMSMQGDQVPQGIMFSAAEPGRGLPMCRALIQNVMNSGWADKTGCHVVYQDRATVVPKFEIVALGQLMPKPTGTQPPLNAGLGALFDYDPRKPTLNK